MVKKINGAQKHMGVWRTIRNPWLAFRDNVRIKVGRGNKALFWKKDWTGQGSLESLFPGLFSICLNPAAKYKRFGPHKDGIFSVADLLMIGK